MPTSTIVPLLDSTGQIVLASDGSTVWVWDNYNDIANPPAETNTSGICPPAGPETDHQ